MMNNVCEGYSGIVDNRYILEFEIGGGSTSTVYKAKDSFSNEDYALKIFNGPTEIFQREILFNQKISELKNHSQFFIRFISSSLNGTLYNDGFSETKCYILYEFASKGDLFKYIFSIKKGLDEKKCKVIIFKILKAVQALHKEGISHNNIKPQNILLVGERFDIKIGDLGLSSFFSKENGKILQKIIAGTDEYMAPEVFLGSKYEGEKADIFSIGILMFSLLKCFIPFPVDKITKKRKYYSFLYKNKEGKFWEILKDLGIDEFSPEFKDLFKKMVHFKPSQRPTIEEILSHDWMKEVTNLNEEDFKKYEESLISELKEREVNL